MQERHREERKRLNKQAERRWMSYIRSFVAMLEAGSPRRASFAGAGASLADGSAVVAASCDRKIRR